MSNPPVRGRFVWHELLTTDPESAAGFYTEVVGWEKQAWSHDPSYQLFVTRGSPMAGLMLLPEEAKAMGAPPCWMSYIGTPDLDETVSRAQGLGAGIVKEPTGIPGVGRFSVLRDPQGAVFAAFTPEQGPQDQGETALGDFSWHELVTTDWQAALDFYARLFGWEKTEAMDMGPGGTYQMYGWPGRTLGGMFNQPPEMPGPPRWLPYVLVPDSHRAAETARRLGGQIVNGPMEVPGGDWIAQGLDLQGVMFAVHSRKPADVRPAPAPAAKKPAKKAAPKKRAAAKKAAKKRPARKKKAAKKRPARRKAAKRRPVRKARAARKKKAARSRPARRKAAKKRAARRPARRAARRGSARQAAGRSKARRKGAAKKKR